MRFQVALWRASNKTSRDHLNCMTETSDEDFTVWRSILSIARHTGSGGNRTGQGRSETDCQGKVSHRRSIQCARSSKTGVTTTLCSHIAERIKSLNRLRAIEAISFSTTIREA